METNKDHDAHESYTDKYQKHTPTGFQLIVVDNERNIVETIIYRGVDCMDVFCHKIVEIEKYIMDKLTINTEMTITDEEQTEFNNSTQCYICNNEIKFNDKKGCKVRDHDHLTGKYRGCAHNVCNLNYNYKDFKIPVFFIILKMMMLI